MKIGLMGCEFSSANKGCEALTYSIISIINDYKKKDSIEIINFSGTDLGFIPKSFPDIKFTNVMPSLKSINYYRALSKCNIILDATMGDSFSDIYSEKYFSRLITHKRLAELFCKEYILLPQTYGPFSTEKSVSKAKKVLNKAKKIYSRDKLSIDFLKKEMNINNVELVSDMAFILPYDKNKYKLNKNNKIKLGINISGLLYKGGFETNNQFNLTIDYKKYIDMILEKYSNDKNYEVYLISHVIDKSTNSYDDDYKISEKIQKKYKNCILTPAFDDPISIKSYIANMDIFIGSRMHSTIASFSSGVVTIPISYSRKFEGLYNDLDYKYVINGRKETTKTAYEKTIDYIENNKELKLSQKKSIKIVEKKNKIFSNDICKYLESSR